MTPKEKAEQLANSFYFYELLETGVPDSLQMLKLSKYLK